MIPLVWLDLLIIVIGFIVLTKSAHKTIEILTRLSWHFRIEEFVISFLLVGMVAILPELSIGINSALEGNPGFGLGIVFGSNVADLTLIIGLVALATNNVAVHDYVIKQSKFLLFAIALPVLLLLDGEISRIDGLILIAAFMVYVYNIYQNRKAPEARETRKNENINLAKEIAVLLIMLALLFASGHFIVQSAESISIELAIPLFFIAILIAVGTCLPELIFSLESSMKKHYELGFGDILGNVCADCMATVGVIALINPIRPQYPELALSSGIFMVAAFIILFIFLGGKKRLSKMNGIFLIMIYILFIVAQFFLEQSVVHGI